MEKIIAFVLINSEIQTLENTTTSMYIFYKKKERNTLFAFNCISFDNREMNGINKKIH